MSTIISDIKEYSDKLKAKYKLADETLNEWQDHIKKELEKRIKSLKQKRKFSQVKQTLYDPEVLEYLQNFKKHFVITAIDKTSHNFAFICKKCYISKILSEIGSTGNDNSTYKTSTLSKEEIIYDNITTSKLYGVEAQKILKSYLLCIGCLKCIRTLLDSDA